MHEQAEEMRWGGGDEHVDQQGSQGVFVALDPEPTSAGRQVAQRTCAHQTYGVGKRNPT